MELRGQTCQREAVVTNSERSNILLAQIDEQWTLSEDGKTISRLFSFANYYKTLAFVNAVAWIAHSQDHHPDLLVSYNRCTVNFSTHSVGGLSDNDFICADSVDQLITHSNT